MQDGFEQLPWRGSHQLGEYFDGSGLTTTAEKEGNFEQILKVLDQHFEYDSRVHFHPTSMATLGCLGSQDNPWWSL